MKAYKAAYMKVWRQENRERWNELRRESNRRYNARRRATLVELKQKLTEAEAKIEELARRAALAVPTPAL